MVMENNSPSSARTYLDTLFDIVDNVEICVSDGSHLSLDDAAAEFAHAVLMVKGSGGKTVLVGNGGSASIVAHMQNDLCAAVGVRAMLCTDTALLTALSNDQSYARAYEKQIELWANTGDMLIAISSSGESENILRATEAAIAQGCGVMTFSGFSPQNTLRRLGDLNFYVPADSYGHVELAHSILTHFLTDWACQQRRCLRTYSTNIHAVDARLKQTEV